MVHIQQDIQGVLTVIAMCYHVTYTQYPIMYMMGFSTDAGCALRMPSQNLELRVCTAQFQLDLSIRNCDYLIMPTEI